MSNTFGLAGVIGAMILGARTMSPLASLAAEPLIDPAKLINQLSNRVFEVVVSAARTQAEIEYDSITYNETLGTVSVNDLVVEPLPHEGMSGCSLAIGHIAFSSSRPAMCPKIRLNLVLTIYGFHRPAYLLRPTACWRWPALAR